MYQIKLTYTTGDSFGSYPGQEDFVEIEWDNIDNAKQNLKRIEEHYQFNQFLEAYDNRSIEKREKLIKEAKEKDWFVNDDCIGHYYTLILYTDDNKPFKSWPVYMGYFESLNCAEIISKVDNGLKIEF